MCRHVRHAGSRAVDGSSDAIARQSTSTDHRHELHCPGKRDLGVTVVCSTG